MAKELLGVKAPKEKCTDGKCPYHGTIGVKKELFKGEIVKRDIHHSATIEWLRSYYIPKYERYEMRKSRMRVHNPPCLSAKVGQTVLVARTRPLSKTKNHVVLRIIDEEKEVNKELKSSKKKSESTEVKK